MTTCDDYLALGFLIVHSYNVKVKVMTFSTYLRLCQFNQPGGIFE